MTKSLASAMPRQLASGSHRTDLEETLAMVKSRRAALDTERRSIQAEDDDLAFMQTLIEDNIITIEGHLKELSQ